jgi:hypothetical protein
MSDDIPEKYLKMGIFWEIQDLKFKIQDWLTQDNSRFNI